ncbi:hypothetical protein J0910_30380 [Nocardiopsis sp. CNT-189]|uniref:hypothetical protein n=1 Tax=Nocardiopsis oceanisediminis TaxID=2816862 RepID=UPI003B2E7D0B
MVAGRQPPEAARAVTEVCGHLPLAVRAAGLRLSYEALDPEERQVFRWAGLLAASEFNADLVGRLVGRPVAGTSLLLVQCLSETALRCGTWGPSGNGTVSPGWGGPG